MADLLSCVRRLAAAGRCGGPQVSPVGQKEFFDLLAVGLEQHGGAAQLADLLVSALDHAVTLARLLVEHVPARGHFEALFCAGFGLELGHLALLCGGRRGKRPGRPASARSSVLIHRRHGSPFGRAAEGPRYGRARRQIQPNSDTAAAWIEARGTVLAARGRAVTAEPAPSPPGGLRSGVPARPWRLWRCRPSRG